VEKTQHAADVSLVWFEHVKRFWHMDATRFAFGVMTRSKAITWDNLVLREPGFVARTQQVFAEQARAAALDAFSAAAGDRRLVYDRGREMAAAALALHDVLVELGDRVTFEPMRGQRVSADPVLEFVRAELAKSNEANVEMRLKLAEEYTKDKAMREAVAAAVAPVQAAISEQAKALAHQGRLIEKIADRMHIPASSQDD
jgi:NADH dehydrogenase/NADH:ubiquinone oxidoreductase subunit G